ncbi:hypothetical protein [Neobittarella massiliensis]|uniref:hypothetical protein n=1 Tax=Neobittarella massiliensis (ex Bilen et al. 2018) TaxID=2041842 RepID=UPI000CF6FF3E|nr:hypothetical protein [Neobittarella massiliensis]
MKKAFVQGPRRRHTGLLGAAALFLCMVVLVVCGVNSMSRSTAEKRQQAAGQAIRRAAVQCYAIEGRYPRDLSYLQKNYGLLLDSDHFVYHYQPLGDNLMPQISVFYLPQEQ